MNFQNSDYSIFRVVKQQEVFRLFQKEKKIYIKKMEKVI